MKVGFAEIDVTAAGAEEGFEVHDPLKARVMVVAGRDGKPLLMLVSMDIMELFPVMLDAVRREISSVLGVPFDAILLHTTHNHCSPPPEAFDGKRLAGLLIEVGRLAMENAVEAEMLTAHGELRGFTVNRRWFAGEKFGAFSILSNDNCRIEPDGIHPRQYAIEELKEMGVRDLPELPDTVLSEADDNGLFVMLFRTPGGGEVLGGLVRFCAHVDQIGGHLGLYYSAEMAGYLTDYMRDSFGGVFLFLNGPNGDIKFKYRERSWDECKRCGEAVAGNAVKFLSNARDAVPLDSVELRPAVVGLPIRNDIPRDAWELVREMWKLRRKRRNFRERGVDWKLMRTWDHRRWVVDTAAYFSHQHREHAEMIQRDTYSYRLTRVTFNGDRDLLFLQDEVFGAFSAALSSKLGWSNTPATVSLTNGGGWYLPPEYEILRLGYEPACSIYAPGGFEKVVDAAAGLFS